MEGGVDWEGSRRPTGWMEHGWGSHCLERCRVL